MYICFVDLNVYYNIYVVFLLNPLSHSVVMRLPSRFHNGSDMYLLSRVTVVTLI